MIASLISYHFVRNNTLLEKWHSKYNIPNEEIKEFNIQVTDNIQTFLKLLSDGVFGKNGTLRVGKWLSIPSYWKEPKVNKKLYKAFEELNKKEDQCLNG